MKKMFLTLARLILILGLFIAATASAQVRREVPEVVNGELAKTLDEYLSGLERQGFAGSILLLKGDQILLRKGYGFSDCKRQRKTTPEMVFDIGSITKTITAVSILKLQAEGKLNINDPISRFLEGVPSDKSAITVQQLLTHRSGLTDSFGKDEDLVTKDWLVRRTLESSLLFPPGEKDSYSNAGYSLLGAIIEKVSGGPYEVYVCDHVLKPAQLTQTGYLLPKWDQQRVVCGYLNGKPWGSTRDYYGKDGPSWHLMANGGMLSTVTELNQWFSALLQNKILPEPMTSLYVQSVTRPTRHGTHSISTSGANKIFSSQFIKWLEEDTTLILFTSDSEWPKEKVVPKLNEEIGKFLTKR